MSARIASSSSASQRASRLGAELRERAARSLSSLESLLQDFHRGTFELHVEVGTRETLQAETDLETLKALGAAKSVSFELCGLNRALSSSGLQAASKLALAYEQQTRVQQPSATTESPSPAESAQQGTPSAP